MTKGPLIMTRTRFAGGRRAAGQPSAGARLARVSRPGRPRRDCRFEPLEGRVLFAAGDLDPSFSGHDGFVSTDVYPYVKADFSRLDHVIGQGTESIYDVAALPDGKLLAVGGGNASF